VSGELITPAAPDVYYQLQLRDWLGGDGSDWTLRQLRGPGGVRTSGQRSKRSLADGSVGGFDSQEPLDIIATLQGSWSSPAAGEEALEDARVAWLPSGADDLELHALRPYHGHQYWLGRPAELDPTYVLMRPDRAVIQIVCTFEALVPDPVDVSGGS